MKILTENIAIPCKNIFKLFIQIVRKLTDVAISEYRLSRSLQNLRIRFDKFLTTRSNESYFRIVKKKKNSDPSGVKFSPRLPLSRAPPLSRFLHEATFFARGQPVSARSENNGRERPRERYSNSCHGRTRLIFTWTRWKARADPQSFPLAVPAAHG